MNPEDGGKMPYLKDSEIEKTMSIVIKEMSEAHKPVVDLSVDLKVEAASGKNWDQAH